MVNGMLAITKMMVKSGLVFNALSSRIPANNARKMTTRVNPATQTTVIVTALRNSFCPCFPGPFMAAELYQRPFVSSRTD